jgi:murein DD-endopeptidase MepM/ murein hydrolase activator NlpD
MTSDKSPRPRTGAFGDFADSALYRALAGFAGTIGGSLADPAVLRDFSVGSNPYAGGQHRGIDVALGGARIVRAPVAGEVTFAGQVATNGSTVTIATEDGQKASLTHLGTVLVERGERVAEGDPVARPGPSGVPEHDEPYVHLGIREANDAYVDPLQYLGPLSVSGFIRLATLAAA